MPGWPTRVASDDLAACHDYLNGDALERSRKGAEPRRAVLFALGVILSELLTLRLRPSAEGRETWEQFARAAAKRPNPAFPARPEDAPDALWRLVERLVMRRDPELATAAKVRSVARAAWDAAGVKDATPEAFREAPAPVEERVERPSRDAPRSSAPSAPPPPAGPAAAPPRPQIGHVYAVQVAPSRPEAAAPVAPAPPRPSATEPPPRAAVSAPAAPAAPPTPSPHATLVDAGSSFPPPDAGADTLSDLDDPGTTAPLPRPRTSSAGGDTLALEEMEHTFADPHASRPDATFALDEEPTTDVLPARGRLPPSREPESNDPFARVRPVGGDTLPIDDARSPLAGHRPIAPSSPAASPASPVTLGLGMRSPMAAPPIRPLPQAGGDTLPLDGPVIGAVARTITPVPTSPPPPRPVSPADQTSQLPAADGTREARGFYSRLAVGVVLGGSSGCGSSAVARRNFVA